MERWRHVSMEGGNDKQKGEDINEGEKSAELKRWNGGMQGW